MAGDAVPPHLGWVEDPRTSVTVSWQREAPGRGTVEYGLTTNYTHAVSDAGGHRRHVITLRDLAPGTLYHYRLSSTDGFQIPDRTFWTAPSATDSLHFVVHGDFQGGLDTNWARTVVTKIVAESPQLVIQTGDLSDERYTSDKWGTWLQLFGVVTDEWERVVFMPTIGNHDEPADGNAFYWRIFTLPERPARARYYSYDAGNVHFVVLNTDIDVASQTNWLARDLQAAANNTNVTWIIPYFHRPPYSWGGHEGNDVVKSNWCPLFVSYEADIVVSGHSHTYQRSVPIRGITYIVTGGGGAYLYSTSDDPGLAFHTTCYHYVSAHVTGSVMRYRALRSDGLVFEDLNLTNGGRFVRVEPAFPRRGDPVKISYRSAGGPLSGAGTVHIHLGVDQFSGAMVSTAMTYNAGSGRWEYTWTVPATAMHRLAWAFYDGGSTWDNNYDYNWQALLDRVEVLPSVPTAGAPVTVRYEEEMGPLAGSSPIYARMTYDESLAAAGAGVVMTNNAVEGVLECNFTMPAHARKLNVVFHDGVGWDDNDGAEWRVAVAGATSAPPWTALPLAVENSPVVTSNPATQNNVGDNLDFNLAGTPARARDADRGFGDFGRIYVNGDATNLYIGGDGLDLGGTNNVIVLFLGLDTLTDNALNLWHKSGKPNTLDFMHNLTFTEPMDVAIVLGSEWGDGPAYTNFDYGGYNFGQGIFYIGTNSSAFVPMVNAGLSQFDGTGTTACASGDDDGDDRTDRWEARLPWSDLNVTSGLDGVDCVFLAGVIASRSTNGSDRYLSSTWLGRWMSALPDAYGNVGYGVMVIEPQKVLLRHGDYDNDGLPDGWEHDHFGSAAGPAAGDDDDGDLFDNWGEYVAGTQPTNGGSVFEAGVTTGSANAVVLSWPGATGRLYDVHRSTNLLASFAPLATNLAAASYTDAVSGVERSFYRVDVRKP